MRLIKTKGTLLVVFHL